ncbi:hypothetical protein HYW17_02120 [Candidatus Uhrbacteria bacterium]|nr:hypothetical protein [Candidatus Uhrbacteria bacterium]
MTPLRTFLTIARALAKSPMHFWDEQDQKTLLKETDDAAKRLLKTLEQKDLKDTQAYKHLDVLEKSVTEKEIDELAFSQALANLVEVYRQSPPTENLQELLEEINPYVIKAKQRVLEYHIALEQLRKKSKKMSEEEKLKSDRETIKNVGVFYVLEYTLQVLWEFAHIPDEDKKKLLTEGLKTKAGNLPAYLPLEDTFRKELCYKMFDEDLRDKLLHAFYELEEVLYSEDLKAIGGALKAFHLELLKAFQSKGMQTYKAVAYAPFGNDVSVEELVKKIETVKV